MLSPVTVGTFAFINITFQIPIIINGTCFPKHAPHYHNLYSIVDPKEPKKN